MSSDGVQPAPAENNKILKGVVGFVDVHSGHVNCSKSVSKLLEQLGATVSTTFNKTVTHVIFKEGGQGTYNKARKRGVPLLAVSWIQSCIEKQEHIAEELFPAIVEEAYNDGLVRVRKKKSLEPVDIEEDLARSAALIKRRQKREYQREIREKYNVSSSPLLQGAMVSNVKTSGISKIPNLPLSEILSKLPTVPSESSDENSEERVPSLVERLYELYPNSPALLDFMSRRNCLRHRVSSDNCNDMSSTFDSSEIGTPKCGAQSAADLEVSREVNFAMKRLKLQDSANKCTLPAQSPSESGLVVSPKDRVGNVTPVTLKSRSEPRLNSSAKKRRRKTLFSCDSPNGPIGCNGSDEKGLESRTTIQLKDDPNDQIMSSRRELKFMTDGEKPNLNKNKSKRQISKLRRELCIGIDQYEVDTTSTTEGQQKNGVVTSMMDSVSSRQLNSELFSGNRRTSLDDFKVIRKRKRPKTDLLPVIESPVDGTHDITANTSVTPTSSRYRSTKHIVLTNFDISEKETIVPIANLLGGCRISFTVNRLTTHVVSGSDRRTMNILFAHVRGCWILKREWVFNSLEAGCWVDEEQFEMDAEFPSAKSFRHQKVLQDNHSFKCTLFATSGPIFVAQGNKLPGANLKELLQLACATVVKDVNAATIVVGHTNVAGTCCVSEQWVLDSISKGELQCYQDYLISPNE